MLRRQIAAAKEAAEDYRLVVWLAPGDDAPGPLRVGRQGARLLHPLLRAGEEERAARQRDARPAAVRAASRGRG